MQIEYERGISIQAQSVPDEKINGKGRGRGNIKHWFPWWFYHAGMSCIRTGAVLCLPRISVVGETFPQAKFHYINAGIGGTTSHFRTACAESDLLSINRILLSLNFRSMMNRRNFSVRHMKDWYAVYGRMKTNLL